MKYEDPADGTLDVGDDDPEIERIRQEIVGGWDVKPGIEPSVLAMIAVFAFLAFFVLVLGVVVGILIGVWIT